MSAVCSVLPEQPEASVQLKLVVVRCHVRAELIKRLVVVGFLEVGQFVDHDHPKKGFWRCLELAGDAYAVMAAQFDAVNTGLPGVHPQRLTQRFQLGVVMDLAQRRRLAQELLLQAVGILEQGLVALNIMLAGVALLQIITQLPSLHQGLGLLLDLGGVAGQVLQGIHGPVIASWMRRALVPMLSLSRVGMIAALFAMDNPMSSPQDSDYPRRGNAFSRALGRCFLRLLGWRLVDPFPQVPKSVVIGGPHTSNWDGIVTLAAMMQMGLDAHVMMKDSAFKGPLGGMLRWMGALPIDRSKAGGVVEQTVGQFNSHDRLVMVVAPEGTRGGAAQWKTGFYRIAEQAGVPIVLATADYAKKEIAFPMVLETTGDLEGDLEQIFQCYAQVEPRHPEKLSAPLKAIRERR